MVDNSIVGILTLFGWWCWGSQIGQWHVADEYDGQVREITFRALCHSPMCPPDSAMTEWQHFVLSSDKKCLVCLIMSTTVSGC